MHWRFTAVYLNTAGPWYGSQFMTAAAADNAKFARQAWIRALSRTASIEREPLVTLPMLIESWAQRNGDSPALISREATFSYAELAARAHCYARWGLAQGLKAGDVAALVLPNCAEYLAIWLGLTRIGMVVALVNTHLSGDALAHSIRIVGPKLMIAGGGLAANLAAVREHLPATLHYWSLGARIEEAGFEPLEPALAAQDSAALELAECAPPTLDKNALYIYTSGTSGLPKAANVTHYRLMQWSHWFAGLLDVQASDRLYDCLPLYHSVGGVVAAGATLVGGGAVVIRPRFSASEFWRDLCEQRCTLFQYIGELCRYLVNAPSQAEETQHRLRVACGNGLRPEVWEAFRSRFRIPQILEYYAATEGSFSLYNCEGKVGSIGRIPAFLAHRLPVALLRFDVETGEPRRNAEGYCERCAVDEVGEAAAPIPEGDARAGRFEGYADPAASENKILRNVFKPGDAWYRSGDLMRCDARGFYYFVDRIGETYRWKGENVSTAEVQSELTAAPGVRDGLVYGVAVPGADGRAGMAALVVDAHFDLAAFRAEIVRRLPSYARPVFLRILGTLDATATFKPQKQELLRAGFDPRLVDGPLYVADPKLDAYVALDEALHRAIIAGQLRF